jgi:drug/metabolite transporter (DMT)-like permease
MKYVLSAPVALIVWVALMASSFVVSAELLPYANPVASTGLRFILAGALMFPFVWRSQQLRLAKGEGLLLKYLVVSLFLVLFFLGLFEALKTTTATRTSVIYTLVPLLTVAVSYLGLKVRPSFKQLIGFALGSVGATWVLLALGKNSISLLAWYNGDIIFLLACLSLAMHVVLIKKWFEDQPSAQSAFYILCMGSVIMFPCLLLFGDLDSLRWSESSFWQAFLYLTIFTTICTFWLQQYLLKHLGPNHLLAVSYVVPLFVLLPQSLSVPNQLYYGLPGIILTGLALLLIFRQRLDA